MSALRANGLIKAFGTTRAVDDVAIDVAPGEVRGLLGRNGAGKTTLLRMLFGLVAPDAGWIELLGQRVDGGRPARLDGISGFVEHPGFYPYLSGRANLELLTELDGGSAAQRIDSVLEQVGLRDRAGDRLSAYSSGMRQRLGIAAALVRAPQLLLLDEPTTGLDPGGVRDVGALLGELSARGVAVLLSSHQIGELEEVCDSFTFLRGGRVVWDGDAERLRAEAPASAFTLATSDDSRALAVAEGRPGVTVRAQPGAGLTVEVDPDCLDPLVLALGREDVAVRRLALRRSPLASMFFALTGGEEAGAG